MEFQDLTAEEQKIIYQCLLASVNGTFFPERGFHTLFGFTRAEVREIIDNWETVDRDSSDVRIAINNSLNNLIGYPHRKDEELRSFVSVSRQELIAVFTRWKGFSSEGYYHNMM